MKQAVLDAVLESLTKLGGHATCKQLNITSGYSEEYVRKALLYLVLEGALQRSSHSPRLFSKIGSSPTPRLEMKLDDSTVHRLAVLHKVQNPQADQHYIVKHQRGRGKKISCLLNLAELAGYDIILIPKELNLP